jgi:hypothetical protein
MAINPDYLTELEMYGGPPRRPRFIDRERLREMAALMAQAGARLTPARATVRDAITETDARARIQDPRFGDVPEEFYPPGQDPRVPSARVQDQAVRAEIEAAHAREAHRAAVNRARGVAQRPAPFLPRPMPLPEPGWYGDLPEIGPARPRPMPQRPGAGPGFGRPFQQPAPWTEEAFQKDPAPVEEHAGRWHPRWLPRTQPLVPVQPPQAAPPRQYPRTAEAFQKEPAPTTLREAFNRQQLLPGPTFRGRAPGRISAANNYGIRSRIFGEGDAGGWWSPRHSRLGVRPEVERGLGNVSASDRTGLWDPWPQISKWRHIGPVLGSGPGIRPAVEAGLGTVQAGPRRDRFAHIDGGGRSAAEIGFDAIGQLNQLVPTLGAGVGDALGQRFQDLGGTLQDARASIMALIEQARRARWR